jgi:hypothetical protein
LLTDLGKKILQWFSHVRGINRTRILRRVLELKFRTTHTEWPRTTWFSYVLKTRRWHGRAGKKSKGQVCGNKEMTGDSSSINQFKTETMLEDDDTSGHCYKFYLEHIQTAKADAFIISMLWNVDSYINSLLILLYYIETLTKTLM